MNPIARLAVLIAPFCVPAFVACIEVGHEAETGCLVDRTQPGCRANGRGGAASGGAGSGGRASGGAGSGGRASGGAAGSALGGTGGSTATGGAAGAVPEGGEGGA